MKPFSKFEAISGKPVVTRGGKPVTQLKEFEADVYRIAGVVDGRVYTWTDGGIFWDGGAVGHEKDLFMAPTVLKGYIGVGSFSTLHGSVGFATHVWATERQAKDAFRIGTQKPPSKVVEVSWEE